MKEGRNDGSRTTEIAIATEEFEETARTEKGGRRESESGGSKSFDLQLHGLQGKNAMGLGEEGAEGSWSQGNARVSNAGVWG